MDEPLLDIQTGRPKRRYLTWALVLIIIGLTVGLIVVALHKSDSSSENTVEYSLDSNTTQRILSFLNESVDPCQDFYEYACGNFHHTVPEGSGQYAYSFNSIGEMVRAQQLEILTHNWPMIGDFYQGCLDVDSIEARGITDLQPWLTRITAATSPSALLGIVGAMQRAGFATTAFVNTAIQSDYHYANKYHLYVTPGGLTLGDPKAYHDAKFNIRGEIFAVLYGLQQQSNSGPFQKFEITKTALDSSKYVWEFESRLANFSHAFTGDDVDRAFVIAHTRMMPNVATFSELTGLDWTSYFTNLAASPNPSADMLAVIDSLDANMLTYWKNFTQLLTIDTDIETLRNYVRWHLVVGVTQYLPEYFRNIGDELSDQYNVQAFRANSIKSTDSDARQRFCQSEAVSQFGNYLSHLWISEDLPAGTIPAVAKLVNQIYERIGDRLNTVDWLKDDNATRIAAVHKWEDIAQNVGPTSGWWTYAHLDMTGIPLLDREIIQTYDLDQTKKLYETYVNRSLTQPNQDWTIQNAYYDPTTNSINLIPGLMFPPFYSPNVPEFLNLATYGMVIGHEITHGFDNSGRLYNGTGAFVNWWTNETAREFDKRADCLINQYNSYPVVNGIHVRGNNTLGENIADNGGVRAAWNAYKVSTANNVPGPAMAQFNNDQLFFVYYAQSWCVNATAAGLERQVKQDVHSPAKWRVNGPLSNLPYFAHSYGCRADQPMGRSLDDNKRCEVW